MRCVAALIAALAAVVTVVNAQSTAAIEAELASLFPSCAVTCLEELVPLSGCGLTDVNCTCTNAALQTNLTACVSVSCTTYESLATLNGSAVMCGDAVRDVHVQQGLVAIIGCSLTFAIYLLRIVAKLKTLTRELAWEDYLITAAMACTIVTSAFHAMAASYGVGKDIWTLSPYEIEHALLYFLMTELAYFTAIGFVKMSMLTLMLRIIPDKQFRLIVFITMGVVVSYTLTFVIATLFQCQPIGYMWNQLNDSYEGSCNEVTIQAEVSVAINIVIDILVMALPIKSLWALQLNMVKKLTVICMFLLGVFVTIISCIRLQAFIKFASSYNFTWNDKDGGNWSLAELFAGIICACLPSLRPLLVVLRIKYNGSSYKTGNSAYANAYIKDAENVRAIGGGTNFSSRVSKPARPSNPPRMGDEGDFVRLVDIEAKADRTALGGDRHSVGGSKILATTTTNVTVDDAEKGKASPPHAP